MLRRSFLTGITSPTFGIGTRRLAGAQVDPAGEWNPREERVPVAAFDLPAASAAALTLSVQ
ncbi:MAG: hypothetical protein JO230_04745 [Xanthobacteraceae bacterium]|nr:hypothetical protein [Xanthobacteraceae bacterium]